MKNVFKNRSFLFYFLIAEIVFLFPVIMFIYPSGWLFWLFLPALVWWNIAGAVIYPIQNFLGFNIIRFEEFGMIHSSPEYAGIVLFLVMLFWSLISIGISFYLYRKNKI